MPLDTIHLSSHLFLRSDIFPIHYSSESEYHWSDRSLHCRYIVYHYRNAYSQSRYTLVRQDSGI